MRAAKSSPERSVRFATCWLRVVSPSSYKGSFGQGGRCDVEHGVAGHLQQPPELNLATRDEHQAHEAASCIACTGAGISSATQGALGHEQSYKGYSGYSL